MTMEQEITAETCRNLLQEREEKEREKQDTNVYMGKFVYATVDDVLKDCEHSAKWGYSPYTLPAYLKWEAVQKFIKKGFTYYLGKDSVDGRYFGLLAWDKHEYYQGQGFWKVDSEEVYHEYFEQETAKMNRVQQVDESSWRKLDRQVSKVTRYFNKIFS